MFSATEAEVDEQATAYGLAATKLTPNGPGYVAATRRHRTEVALLKLVALRDGTVTYSEVDRRALPVVTTPVGPAFPQGLFVTHDGENTPDVLDPSGEVRANTDFKFVRWDAILGAVGR